MPLNDDQAEIKKKEDKELTAKEWLLQYRECVNRCRDIETAIIRLRLDRMFPSQLIDGMPHTHDPKDLSSYAAAVDTEITALQQERYRRIRLIKEIDDAIESIPIAEERQVLYLRYLQLQSWQRIARTISCDERTVYRIHSRALQHLKLSVNVSFKRIK